jgi:hypothetical protein
VGVNARLDRIVVWAHRRRDARHPYHIAEDVALTSWIVAGCGFQRCFGHFSGVVNAVVITVTFVLYTAVYLRLKHRVTGVSARSTLPDTLLFVGPVYVALSVACRQPLGATLDMLAFTVLLAVAFMRIGCFLSGCCHGKSSRLGVHYPAWVLREVRGSRPYTPAPFTGQRVLPIQLVESAYLFLVIVLLWFREGQLSHPNGSTLALAAIAYCTVRFGLEFARGHRHRPTTQPCPSLSGSPYYSPPVRSPRWPSRRSEGSDVLRTARQIWAASRVTIVAAGSALIARQPVPAQRLGTSGSPVCVAAARSGRVRWCTCG